MSTTPQGTCPTCGAALGDAGVCTSCGTALAVAPRASVRPGEPGGDELESGRVIAGRYRIVRPLGKGGMGEVVLARDLELDQLVALKFLPDGLRDDPGHLARLRDEVKLARRVSHPNVCRVHDLGESRGRAFLTMEYVDGEDLGALLRRIGRVPPEKAVELAHQLCSGLHAAHEQGILHRDLKPANVMIDGDGRLKITDFGLAALAHDVAGAHAREGTPAYMAPEQLVGSAVGKTSDIYALGLVLYELFTGKRAHAVARARDTRPAAPSTLIDGLDPAIERVIMRCLEPEPDDRPASVLAVAAALPGGDPIGAALAAGELPSPEMVAASGDAGTLHPRAALAWLALVLVPLLVLGGLFGSVDLLGRLPTPDSPDVLAHGAREIAATIAEIPTGESAQWLEVDHALANALVDRDEAGEAVYDDPPRHPLSLVWRADPGPLVAHEPLVSGEDPPFLTPGALLVGVDARGRLIHVRRKPAANDRELALGDADATWDRLLAHTGLDPATIERTEPTLVPPDFADERRAWTAAWPDGTPARVEAASVRGVPGWLVVLGPWSELYREAAGTDEEVVEGSMMVGTRTGSRVVEGFEVVVVLALAAGAALLVLGGVVLAIRSVRRGEGDRRTAARAALFVIATDFAAETFGGHLTGNGVLGSPFERLPFALLHGATLWLVYIALEPYARRFWPHALVSWSRCMRGRWRDPLVGRDVLVGTACACTMLATAALSAMLSPGARLHVPELDVLLGARYAIAAVVGLPRAGLWMGCLVFIAVVVARLVLRRQWATVAVTVAAPASVLLLAEPTAGSAVTGIVFGIGVAIVVFRAGLLGAVAWATTLSALTSFPWTLETDAWYAGIGSLAGLVVGGLAIGSFWIALGGRPVLGDGFFGR